MAEAAALIKKHYMKYHFRKRFSETQHFSNESLPTFLTLEQFQSLDYVYFANV